MVAPGARPPPTVRGPAGAALLGEAPPSRRHPRLDVRGGVLVLSDLGSTNGARANGRRVREVVLGIGDRIELGQTVLRVVEAGPPGA